MKRLTLARHAKADWGSGVEDFNIELTEKGRGDAPIVGKMMKEEGIVPDLIVCSGAVRAEATARLLIKAMGLGETILRVEGGLHNALASEILEEIKRTSEEANHLMVIGHNPGMSELASAFAGEAVDLSTCELASFSLDVTEWAECEINKGVLTKIIRNPK